MGLDNNTTNNTFQGTSLSIVGGKFTIRVPEGTEGAESRELEKGKNAGTTIWELKYKSLEGLLVHGSIEDNEYIGKTAKVVLEDGPETYQVDLSLESSYLYQLIKHLPNINPIDAVRIELHDFISKKTGKQKILLNLYQNGNKIKNFFEEWKKDSSGKNVCHCLNGMPPPEETRKGLDWTKQEDFLLGKFEEFFESIGNEDFSDYESDLEEQGIEDNSEVPF